MPAANLQKPSVALQPPKVTPQPPIDLQKTRPVTAVKDSHQYRGTTNTNGTQYTVWQVTTTTTYQSGPPTVTTQEINCPVSQNNYDNYCGTPPPSPSKINTQPNTQRTNSGGLGPMSP
jgi:hypothetical protein